MRIISEEELAAVAGGQYDRNDYDPNDPGTIVVIGHRPPGRWRFGGGGSGGGLGDFGTGQDYGGGGGGGGGGDGEEPPPDCNSPDSHPGTDYIDTPAGRIYVPNGFSISVLQGYAAESRAILSDSINSAATLANSLNRYGSAIPGIYTLGAAVAAGGISAGFANQLIHFWELSTNELDYKNNPQYSVLNGNVIPIFSDGSFVGDVAGLEPLGNWAFGVVGELAGLGPLLVPGNYAFDLYQNLLGRESSTSARDISIINAGREFARYYGDSNPGAADANIVRTPC
jgi:hypothetical protein